MKVSRRWSSLFVLFAVGVGICIINSLKVISFGRKDVYLYAVNERTQLISDVCSSYEGIRRRGRFHPHYFMIVDDKHKLIYCMIPKVACTTFQLLIAESLKPGNVSERYIHFPSYIHSLGMNYLQEYSKKGIELRLKTYFKFIVVRHPFDRLLSAFADKFIDPERNMMTFARLRKRAELRFGKLSNFDKRGQPLLSLDQFLELIAYDKKFDDKHWQSYNVLCQPCWIHYDHVIRLETIEKDIGTVLDHLNYTNGSDILRYSSKRHNAKRNVTNKLREVNRKFMDLRPDILQGLLKIYEDDFNLFGYTWNKTSGAGYLENS